MVDIVGNVTAMGQPTRPTQPSIPSASLNGLRRRSPLNGKPGLRMAVRHRSKSVGASLAYDLCAVRPFCV